MNNFEPKMCFFLHVTPNHFVGSDIFQQELEKNLCFRTDGVKSFWIPPFKGKIILKANLPSTVSIVLLLKSAKTAGCLISVPHHSFPA